MVSGGVRCVVARSVARPTLLEVLVRHGLAREPIEQALRRLGGVSLALGQTLVSEGVLSEEQLAKALAEQYGLPTNRSPIIASIRSSMNPSP